MSVTPLTEVCVDDPFMKRIAGYRISKDRMSATISVGARAYRAIREFMKDFSSFKCIVSICNQSGMTPPDDPADSFSGYSMLSASKTSWWITPISWGPGRGSRVMAVEDSWRAFVRVAFAMHYEVMVPMLLSMSRCIADWTGGTFHCDGRTLITPDRVPIVSEQAKLYFKYMSSRSNELHKNPAWAVIIASLYKALDSFCARANGERIDLGTVRKDEDEHIYTERPGYSVRCVDKFIFMDPIVDRDGTGYDVHLDVEMEAPCPMATSDHIAENDEVSQPIYFIDT